MKCKFINKKIDYTGEQLRSHFIYENFGLEGDAIISFIGSCDVNGHMVDLSDKKNKEFIFSESMLHFLCEHFEAGLEKTIMRKRILISIILEELHKSTKKILFERNGNGIYAAGPSTLRQSSGQAELGASKKLTVAVATASPISTLIHAGLNITSKNTPIATACLKDYGVKPEKFANIVMDRYCGEMESIKISRRKVKGVK